MQFDTTINRWHTAANTGRINGSNPCSEYMHLDNSACNLASLNLLAFLRRRRRRRVRRRRLQGRRRGRVHRPGDPGRPGRLPDRADRARRAGASASSASATPTSAPCSWRSACPTTATPGRAWAAAITALMTGHAYEVSARTAARMGPFAGYAENARAHAAGARHAPRRPRRRSTRSSCPPSCCRPPRRRGTTPASSAERYGVRNSQASVLAPTGTIGLMMDCDTTGIEPDLGLVKLKKLVGGGHDVDRQPDGAPGAAPPRLRPGPDRRDRRLHRRAQVDPRRPPPRQRARAGVRLLDGRQRRSTTWATSG